MVGFSTLLNSEEGNAKAARRDVEANLDPLIARERRALFSIGIVFVRE
jgi:hypothetical protein